MNWGDVPAWAAFALSAGALWVSVKARGDGRKSAAAAETSADASVRSAVAAEEALAHQRQEAEERRAAEEAAGRPRVRLRIEKLGIARFRMVNYGDASAPNVVVDAPPAASRGLAQPFDLDPATAHSFQMVSSAGNPLPNALRVTWDGQSEPVSVLMP